MSASTVPFAGRTRVSRLAIPRIGLGHVWVALSLAATFVVPASTPVIVLDLGWTLKAGAWMVEHGALLVTDPFTSAPPLLPQINAQWLAQLAYYGLERVGGLALVIAGNAAVEMAAYGILLLACLAASGHIRVACLAMLAGYALGFTNLGARPQTLAYPLFALTILAVMRARNGQTRPLWVLPPMVALWANLHGSYPLALLLVGIEMVGAVVDRRSLVPVRTFGPVLAACFLACFATPYGAGSLTYVVGIGGNEIIRNFVTEWAPTSVSYPEGVLFFVSLAVVGSLILWSRQRLTTADWLMLAAFGWLGVSGVRAVVWWGMVAAPLVARLLTARLPIQQPVTVGRNRPVLNWLIVLGIVGIVGLSLPWFKSVNPLLPANKRGLLADGTPVRAAQYLQQNPLPGRLFNFQGWGGYLVWVVWPTNQPFLDGRIELHPTQVWLDYLYVTYPVEHWQDILDSYGIHSMVLSREHNGDFIAVVLTIPEWRTVYADDEAVVFVRE